MTGKQNVQTVYQKEPTVISGGKDTQSGKALRGKNAYDYPLLISVIFIFAFGLLMIYSGSRYVALIDHKDATYYFSRQLRRGCIGLAVAIVCSKVNYKYLKAAFFWIAAYLAALILPLVTLIMGAASHGKTRWLSVLETSFQPAELTKLGLIVSLSVILSAAGSRLKDKRFFWVIFGMGIIPAGLIFCENLSSGFIILFIVAVLMFAASERWKLFACTAAAGVGAFAAAKPLIRTFVEKSGYTSTPTQYWLRRILAWALPERYATESYQTTQGLYAIGSGGMLGRGLGESIQKFGKIPEVQNDMIFSVICEEFGFLGAATVIVLYMLILIRIYIVAKNCRDMFGKLLCCGVMAHIGIQVVLNIAVVTGVFPNTGVTLPFISYGGTAIMCTMAEIGIVLSVSNQNRKEI